MNMEYIIRGVGSLIGSMVASFEEHEQYTPLSDKEAWEHDAKALASDWRIVLDSLNIK